MIKENGFAKAAKIGLFALNPTSYLISEALTTAIGKSKRLNDSGTIAELEEEAARQELANRISESQAKVAQELAIARRIESADEVEIEEYYDLSGDGNIGLNANESSASLGINGAGRKITKRIYRFKGWNEDSLGVLNEEFMKENVEK
ncbi:hypothetical protein AB1K83_06890 [Sporosarcina sp. 179-K 3D1 HS]|uniref:hypothetical protein n=1 Tax=Sporosarcina sp. 179-K 3D1 HS TaxID=3232169 RepID=UPI0039A19F2B